MDICFYIRYSHCTVAQQACEPNLFIIPIFFLELSTLNILVHFNARLREFGIRETRYANYRVAVGLLVGQGWEQRRPTLPKLYVSKARPKALVFLHLDYLFSETNG